MNLKSNIKTILETQEKIISFEEFKKKVKIKDDAMSLEDAYEKVQTKSRFSRLFHETILNPDNDFKCVLQLGDVTFIWKNGIWHGGVWGFGLWENGTWEKGLWKNGTWEKGVWNNGIWEGGTWKNGKHFLGNWYSGTWKSGIWYYGLWLDGTWENGTWKDGTWKNGIWKGGEGKPKVKK
jgi:hypothetical protein